MTALLRVAVPNKGALSESAAEILSEAGYRRRRDPKDLTVIDPVNNVEFFFLRPKDIAIYVGSGQLDFGITGRDLAADSDASVHERLALGFGNSTFRYAGPKDRTWTVADLADRTGVSRSTLAKRFSELVGEAPLTYLTHWRMALAADRLTDEYAYTVAEVGRSVGYADPFAFSAAFKRVRGVNPREFRRSAVRA